MTYQPRVTAAQIAALPVGAAVVDRRGDRWVRFNEGNSRMLECDGWVCFPSALVSTAESIVMSFPTELGRCFGASD